MTNPVPPADYIVGCPSCAAPLNASTAPFCHCVSKRPNVLCAECGKCTCKAGEAAIVAFWHYAPASVLARRTAEQKARKTSAAQNVQDWGDVIVIDDDEEIRMITSFMLQQMGYRVSVASDPAEVLWMIETRAPRVVITDALMPKLDGRQLCRMIKAINDEVRVVVMTSLYTAPHYKYEAYKNFRADAYLAKPIDFTQLQQILDKLSPLTSATAATAVSA